MASLLSPGVITREIDLTTVTPAVATTEGGIAMHAQWGPAEKLVLVTDEIDLRDVFGKPNNDNATDWFTAKNFLSYSSALFVSRALPSDALNSSNGDSGILIKNLDDYERQTYTYGEWAAKYPGELGNSLKISLADNSTFDDWEYKSLFSEKPDLDGLHIVVIDEDGLISGDKGSVLEKFEFLSKFSDAKSEDGSSLYYVKVINDTSEYIWSLDHYVEMVGWGQLTESYLTFDPDTGVASLLSTANSNDISLKQSTTLGTYNLTLNPKKNLLIQLDSNDPDVANLNATSFTTGDTIEFLDGDNVDMGITATVVSWDSGSSTLTISSSETILNTYQVHTADHEKLDISSVTEVDIPFNPGDFTAGDAVSQGSVSATVTAWDETIGGLILTSEGTLTQDGGDINGFSIALFQVTETPQSITVPSTHSLDYGFKGTISKASDRVNAMKLFKDDELVDISFLLGGDASKEVIQEIFSIVFSRQDCLGVISPERDHVVNAQFPVESVKEFRESLKIGSLKDLKGSFMVMDDNWKYQFDRYNNLNRWIPCNGDTAGLMAETDLERAAWFSPGGRSLKNVIKLAWKSKKAERDVLYPLGINSITTFPGEGAILYGDRTMLRRPSAFDRINVRRLFIVLRKTISRTARSFLFEINTEFTRERFKSTVIPFLEEVQGRQGITDFLVVCDGTNNTGQVIEQNRFIGDIYIKPTRSINFIELNFVAVRTDVEFSEVVGSV